MTATIVGPGGSVKVRDDDGHELEINADGSINVTGGTGGGGDASEATLLAILAELQQKLEEGQEVALDAATLAALESITAAISGTVAVSNMIPAVETDLAKETTLGRKFELIVPFSGKFSANEPAVVTPAVGERLRVHQLFTQASPTNAGHVEFELAIGGIVVDSGWLKPSQPSAFVGLYEGGIDESLALTLTPSGTREVRVNARYRSVT